MKKITMLTSPTCSYCHAAKNLLQQKGFDYQEVNLIDENELGLQLLQKSGQRTVPQIFINEKPIGGYTELNQLFIDNEFDLILNSPI